MSKKEDETPQPIRIAGIEISVAEQSPLILSLLAVIQKQDQEIQELRDEIQRLKKTTRRPEDQAQQAAQAAAGRPRKTQRQTAR